MKIEKVKKLVANLRDQTEYVICIRNLKQTLNYGLVLKEVQAVIKRNQNAMLKPYIDMNTDLTETAKSDFEKDYRNHRKTIENVRKSKNIKPVTTERWGNYLVSEPNYRTTKFFTQNLLAIEMKKQK